MKKIILLFIILICISNTFSQTKISGKVTDKNNAPLVGANVFIKDTYDGTSTKEDGGFNFSTDEKSENAYLIVSYIGYKQYTKEIALNGMPINLDIVLEEDTKELGTVVISAGYFEASDEKKSIILRPLDILTTGSDADIYSTLETLPGTQQVGETEGLFVRGGAAYETKTIIDEMLVQNPFYASIPDVASRGRFTPSMFKGTMFSMGGYSAQYGQALSSVLILKSQDLPEKTQTAISMMIVGIGGAHTQKWENSSLSFELGYYNLAPFLKILPQRIDWIKSPESIESSLNYKIKTSDSGILKIFSSFNTGRLSLNQINLDDLSKKDFYQMKDKNFFFNANIREVLGEDWIFFSGYSYSDDKTDVNFNNDKIIQQEIMHTGKVTVSKPVFGNSYINFGSEIQSVKYKNQFNQSPYGLDELYLAGFLETDIFFTNDIAMRVGLRGERSKLLNKNNVALRSSLAYRLSAFSQLNFAFGQFYQTPEPDYLFYTTNFDFEKATHYIFNYQFIGDRQTFRVELFYKDYSQLAKGTTYTYPVFNLPFVPFSNLGDGYAKGIDIFWRDSKTLPYADYWLSYSYLDTKRDYKNYPTTASPTFAAKHTFSLVFKYWVQSITTFFGLTYQFASGRPYFNPNNPEFLGDRTKEYHNLSLNASYLTSIFNNFTVIFFSIDNLIGHSNIYDYRYSTDGLYRAGVLPPALRTFFVGMFISLGEQNPY